MTSGLPDAHILELDRLASSYWWHAHRARLAIQKAAEFASTDVGRYLDIGCGPGSTTLLVARGLSKRGLLGRDFTKTVLGVDSDSRMERFCAQKNIPFVRLDLESETKPTLSGESFGFFTMLDVLEHLEDPRVFLSRLRPSIPPRGIGVVTVPAFESLRSAWDDAAGHYRRYSRSSLQTVVENSGFRLLWQSYFYAFAFLPAWVMRKVRARNHPQPVELTFPSVRPWMNSSLNFLGRCERVYLRFGRLPVGTSLIALIERV